MLSQSLLAEPEGRPRRPAAAPSRARDGAAAAVVDLVAQNGAGSRRRLLVRWVGYAPEEDSWEKRSELVKTAAKKVAEWEALQQN